MTVWKDMKDAPRDGSLLLAHNCILGTTAVVGFTEPAHMFDEAHWSDVGNKNQGESLWFNEHYFTHWTELPLLPPREQLALPL